MNDPSLKENVMERIEKGSVHMKPRWRYALFSAFAFVGIALVIFTLVYVASLCIFLLRDSGVWFAPSFGYEGWLILLHGLPYLLIALLVVFIALLAILVRRFAFVYQKSLLTSLLGILVIAAGGGLLVGYTPAHRYSYRGPFEVRMKEVHRGTVIGTTTGGLLIYRIEGGTSTILLTPKTRLPYGEAFEAGTAVIIMGQEVGNGTIRAFGVRAVGE